MRIGIFLSFVLFLSNFSLTQAQTFTRDRHLPERVASIIEESNVIPLKLYGLAKTVNNLSYADLSGHTFYMPTYYSDNSAPRTDFIAYYDRSGNGPPMRLHHIPYAKLYDSYSRVSAGIAADRRIRKEIYLEFSHSINNASGDLGTFGTLNPSSNQSQFDINLTARFIVTQRVRRTGDAADNPGFEEPSGLYMDDDRAYRDESGFFNVETFKVIANEAKFINIDESLLLLTLCRTAVSINLYDYFTDKNGVTFTIEDQSGNQVHEGNILELNSLASGDYKLSASKAYVNGNFKETIDLKLVDLPSGEITGTATTLCEGQTSTLNVAQAPEGITFLYKWFRNNQEISGQTTSTLEVSETGSYSAEITAEGSECITQTNPYSVTVNRAPIPTIQNQTGSPIICEGESVRLIPSERGVSYLWLNENDEEVGNSQLLTISEAGSYRVLVEYENGCSNISDPITISIIPNPKPMITPSGETTFCEGGSVTLLANLPDGFIAQSYRWSNGRSEQAIDVTESGTYFVTATNSQGCTAQSDPITIVVNPNPKPEIQANSPLEFCEGGEVVLTAPPAPRYLWNNGDTTQSITVTRGGIVFCSYLH